MAAMLLAKRGYDVLLAEEHQQPGFPVQCAGLISDTCLEAYSKYFRAKKAVEKKIDGAFFFSPSCVCVEARGKAFVVERRIFDHLLFQKAAELAEVAVKARVEFGDRILVAGKSCDPDFVIGADGVYSSVAKFYGFERPGIYSCLQIEAKFEAIDERYVELYFGNAYSDFFAYAIPIDDFARIGVICKGSATEKLRILLRKHPEVSRRVRGSIIELNAGAIPDRLVKFVRGRVALIGDAAGMVKPYTGGGLYYLLVAAEILAENFPSLKGYESAYLKELGREYRMGEMMRKLYVLRDDVLDGLFEVLSTLDLSRIHMDRPSLILNLAPEIVFRLLRRPGVAFAALKKLLWD